MSSKACVLSCLRSDKLATRPVYSTHSCSSIVSPHCLPFGQAFIPWTFQSLPAGLLPAASSSQPSLSHCISDLSQTQLLPPEPSDPNVQSWHCVSPLSPADWESSDSILHMQHLTFMETHCWLFLRRKQWRYSTDMMNIANGHLETGRSFHKQLSRMGALPPFTVAPHSAPAPQRYGALSHLQGSAHAIP